MAGSTEEVATGRNISARMGNGFSRGRHCLSSCLLAFSVMLAGGAGAALAGPLDDLTVERFKELREAERYQYNIADKYYREQNWKVALAEFEKFLTLHEKSVGAPNAQLRWSLCQVHLRKLNTAIKEGFQTVIDYWPDSPEAVSAAYFIGRTYQDMGEMKSAKKALNNVLMKNKGHLATVLARIDLAEIARLENEIPRRVSLLKDVVFNADRTQPGALSPCQQASIALAQHYFSEGNFGEGAKSLATTYSVEQMPYHATHYAQGPAQTLTAETKTRQLGEKLADDAAVYITGLAPTDLKDDATKQVAKNCQFYIADMYNASRQPDKSRKIYDQLIEKFGAEDDILYRLAQWLKTQSKRDEARQTFARYKDDIEGQNQVAYSYREEHNPASYAKAAEIYTALIARDGKNATRWQGEAAHALRDAGKYKEAIAMYRTWDSFPQAYWYMAVCHRALNEYKEALALFHQCATDPAWSSQALLQIGYTYEQSGENEKAIKSLQAVCKRFPKSGEASQAHAHLQNKYKITATLGGAKDE